MVADGVGGFLRSFGQDWGLGRDHLLPFKAHASAHRDGGEAPYPRVDIVMSGPCPSPVCWFAGQSACDEIFFFLSEDHPSRNTLGLNVEWGRSLKVE